jgi:CDP-glucose 4,6-dehydratase
VTTVAIISDEFWRGKRVLVTGATGIVGSRVAQLAHAAGAEVVALVRDENQRSEFYRSPVSDHAAIVHGQLEDFWTLERAINEHEVDTVLHLGAQTIVTTAERFPLQTFEANIRGTYNLLEACRLHSSLVKRIAVASSDKAYGDHAGAPYDEETPLAANHPYDVSKACGDLIARAYAHTYGSPVAIARCGNIYGPGDLNWSRIVPGTIRAFLAGQQPVLRSDGSPVRDYLHVADAAAAYLLLAEHADQAAVRGQAFNFSGGATHTVLGVVQQIAELMGLTEVAPVVLDTARNEIPAQSVSADRARKVLGWQPTYDLCTGLKDTIAWYRGFPSIHQEGVSGVHVS